LRDFAQHAAVGEPKFVGVGMNVDEAGRERLSFARDGDERLAFRAVPDDGDFAVGEGNIGDVRGTPVPVVDASVTENCVQQRLA
jgi:hypothetical protein